MRENTALRLIHEGQPAPFLPKQQERLRDFARKTLKELRIEIPELHPNLTSFESELRLYFNDLPAFIVHIDLWEKVAKYLGMTNVPEDPEALRILLQKHRDKIMQAIESRDPNLVCDVRRFCQAVGMA